MTHHPHGGPPPPAPQPYPHPGPPMPSPSWPQQQPPESQEIRLPSWSRPLLIAIVSALTSGAVGVGVGRTTAESPAVIVTNLDNLKDSQARTERALEKLEQSQSERLDRLDGSVQRLQTEMVTDRWRGTDDRAWVTSEFQPLRSEVRSLKEEFGAFEARLSALEER